jgi:hypothetical protein
MICFQLFFCSLILCSTGPSSCCAPLYHIVPHGNKFLFCITEPCTLRAVALCTPLNHASFVNNSAHCKHYWATLTSSTTEPRPLTPEPSSICLPLNPDHVVNQWNTPFSCWTLLCAASNQTHFVHDWTMTTLYTTETSPIMYSWAIFTPFCRLWTHAHLYTIDPRSVLLLLSSMHWTKTTFCITEPLRLCESLNHARCVLCRVRPTVTDWCLPCAVRKYAHFVKHRTTDPLSSAEP